MYNLHLQYPALTLHPRGLHGRLVPPSRATPPFRRRSPSSPVLPSAAAGRRFAYAPRASVADNPQPDPQDEPRPKGGFWAKWTAESAEMRARVAKLGLAAVLAYGLFDAVTYTTFFVLAFLGYEKSTGKNPAANLKALLGIVILMWTGNNVTRPFRVAGAAALAPVIDRGLKVTLEYLILQYLVVVQSHSWKKKPGISLADRLRGRGEGLASYLAPSPPAGTAGGGPLGQFISRAVNPDENKDINF